MYASSGVVCRAFTHDPTYRGWKVTGYKNIRILKTTLTQSHPVQTQLLCTFFARSGTAYSWTGHARVLGEKTWKRDYLTAWFARILCTLQKEVQRSIQVRWRNVSFNAQSFTRAPAGFTIFQENSAYFMFSWLQGVKISWHQLMFWLTNYKLCQLDMSKIRSPAFFHSGWIIPSHILRRVTLPTNSRFRWDPLHFTKWLQIVDGCGRSSG